MNKKSELHSFPNSMCLNAAAGANWKLHTSGIWIQGEGSQLWWPNHNLGMMLLIKAYLIISNMV